MDAVSAAAVAFGVTVVSAPIALWTLRRARVLDVPTSRSSHDVATPRSGGLSPSVACIVAVLVSTTAAGSDRAALLVVATGMGLIGFADDVHPLGVRPRLLGQTVVAALALGWLATNLGGALPVRVAAAAAVVVWLVGYVNAFNFMDGINGLSAVQVVVAGTTWAIVGSHEHVAVLVPAGLIPAAAMIGFTPFNAPRARMFLGDSGSYFLGGWLAATVVIGVGGAVAPESLLAPLTVYLADTTATLLRRVRRHENWTRPHKQHVYQRLVAAGWSHARTAMALGALMAAAGALGVLSLTGSWLLRILGDAGCVGLAGAYLALPSSLAKRTTRR